MEHNEGKGLTGKLGALGGFGNWTGTTADCCDINDMGVGDMWENDDGKGAEAEAIAQEDLQVVAAHTGGFIKKGAIAAVGAHHGQT